MEVKELKGYVKESFIRNPLDKYLKEVEMCNESRIAVNGVSGKSALFGYLTDDKKLSEAPYVNINFDFSIIGDKFTERSLDFFVKIKYFEGLFKLLESRGINLLDSEFRIRYANYMTLKNSLVRYLESSGDEIAFPILDYMSEFMEISGLLLDIRRYLDIKKINLIVDNFDDYDNNRKIQDKISWYFNNFDNVIISCNSDNPSSLYPYGGYHIINLSYSISDIWDIVENRFKYINEVNVGDAIERGTSYNGKYYTKLEYLINMDLFSKIVKTVNYNIDDIFDMFDEFYEVRCNTDSHLFNSRKTLSKCLVKRIEK